MRAWLLSLVVLSLVCGTAVAAKAGRAPYSPRLRPSPSRYGVMATYHYQGRVVQRYTYPGYVHQLPPPAFLYYGYPQSGHSHGVGF